MRQKLNLITLGVTDLQAAADFYETGLGWKRSSVSVDDMLVFSLGAMVLAFYPRKLLAEDARVDDKGDGFSGITLAYNATSEKEVDEVLDKAASLGATITKPAQKVFWGGYNGYFKDPNGFLVEVAYNPFWPLNENGDIELPEK